MAETINSTAIFLVGHFTQQGKQQLDRDNLLGPKASAKTSNMMVTGSTTVHHFFTTSQELDVGIGMLCANQGTGTVVVVPMREDFGQGGDLQAALNQYLLTDDGKQKLAHAEHVQVCKVDLTLAPRPHAT
jgi:hypothetical protein